MGFVVSRDRLDTLQAGILLQVADGVDLVGGPLVTFCLLNHGLLASDSLAARDLLLG